MLTREGQIKSDWLIVLIPYCYLLLIHKVSVEIASIYGMEAGSQKKVNKTAIGSGLDVRRK